MDENKLSEDTVIHFGGEVKALPDNKIGGYLVTFGGLDMVGDYFTAETDFGEYSKLPVLYHHGFDETIGSKRIGTAEIKQDEIGLWAEAQLSMRDEYEKMVYDLAKNGKLGWSSGAASHVTKRLAVEGGNVITQWYMAEASLTPTPAEPRNSVITLKSYLGEQPTEGNPEAVKAESEVGDNSTIGDVEMDKEELQALMDEVSETAALKAVEMYKESEPAIKSATLTVTKDEADQPISGPEFFKAVKTAAYYPSSLDPRLLPLKASGLNEAIPSQGGFLVPEQVAAGMIENVWQVGSLMAQFPRTPVAGNSMTFNVVDETSRADGSRYGGVTGYWLAEAATKTASKPAFRQLELKLKKCAAMVYATDELLEDTVALTSWINSTVPNELRFMIEDAMINGNGVGKPLGILQSPALVTFARVDASEIDAVDIGNLWARRLASFNDYIWLGNQGIFPQMLNLSIGNVPVFLPSGGLSGLPYATLLGRPYFDTEYNPTLGEIGDLMLVSPSAYKMIEKSGVQAASSIHVAFTTDESLFRFVMRIDGAPSFESAITGHDGVTYSPFVALTSSS